MHRTLPDCSHANTHTHTPPTHPQDVDVDIENVHGTVSEWIAQPGVARKVRRVFCTFLLSYVDEENHAVYKQRIQSMVAGGSGEGGGMCRGCLNKAARARAQIRRKRAPCALHEVYRLGCIFVWE